MVQEPFSDPQGMGQRWTCLLCGESLEQYEQVGGGMTPEQLDELMQPIRRGRPPGRPRRAD